MGLVPRPTLHIPGITRSYVTQGHERQMQPRGDPIQQPRRLSTESHDGGASWWGGTGFRLLRGLLVAATALVVAWPLLTNFGYPQTHESLRYAGLLLHFREAMQAGILYPRWLPHLASGYGYPTFVFYGPLFFHAAGILGFLLDVSAARAVWVTSILFAGLGAIGVYRLSRLYADVPTALFVAVLYTLTPYQFVNLYVRGDLSEFASMQIVPWCVFFSALLYRRSCDRRTLLPPAAGMAVSLAMVVIAHPLTVLGAWPLVALLLFAGFLAAPRGAKRPLAVAGSSAFLLALVLSSVHWFPLLQMKNSVGIGRAFEGYFSASGHVVHFKQLFLREFGFGASTLDDAEDGMSFQLGAPHFVLATLGIWFGRRHRLLVACYMGYLALIGLMLPVSRPLWEHIELMWPFQFPWRLLAVIATVQAACCIGWAYVPANNVKQRLLRGVLFVLLLTATVSWHSNQFGVYGTVDFATAEERSSHQFELAPFQWQTFAGVEEFMPRSASKPRAPRGTRRLLEVRHGAVVPLKGNTPYHLRFKIVSQQPTSSLIQQFYFPGWRVVVDGEVIPPSTLEKTLTDDGRMSLELPACPDGCVVEAWYAGPPGDRARWIAAIAAAIVFVCALSWYDLDLRHPLQIPGGVVSGTDSSGCRRLRVDCGAHFVA